MIDNTYSIDGVVVKTPSTLSFSEEYETGSIMELENGKELIDYKRTRKHSVWGYENITGLELKGILGNTVDTFSNTKTYVISFPGINSNISFTAHLDGGVAWELNKNHVDPLKRIYKSIKLNWREQ